MIVVLRRAKNFADLSVFSFGTKKEKRKKKKEKKVVITFLHIFMSL
jgi:hypothetical protein